MRSPRHGGRVHSRPLPTVAAEAGGARGRVSAGEAAIRDPSRARGESQLSYGGSYESSAQPWLITSCGLPPI